MVTYKITNITNTLGKREFKFNSTLDVSFVNGMERKIIKLKPGDSVYLTIPTLPLSIHRLRMKGLVTVVEVNENDLPSKKKTKRKSTKKSKVIDSEPTQKKTKRKSTKKTTTSQNN